MDSVADVLDELRIEYLTGGHHHTTSGWYQVQCPDCSPDSGKYRLGIHSVHGNASCWTCGPKNSWRMIAALANVPVGQVAKLMKAVQGRGFVEQVEHSGRYTVPFPVGSLKNVHKRYLKGRGYDPDELTRLWQVEGIGGDGGSWKWRLFVPVVLRAKPVSWVTRAVTDTGLRYKSAESKWEAVPHKSTLYGLDYVRHTVVVVEGPTGCWRIGPGCVATFGTRFEQSQVSLLAQVPRRFIVFDPEAEAQAQARRLCDLLSGFNGVTELVKLPAGVDPGTLSPKQVRWVRRLLE